MKAVGHSSLLWLQFIRAKLAWLAVANIENSARIFSSIEYYDNLCSRMEYMNFRRLPLALGEQISLVSWPVNFTSVSIDSGQVLNFSELYPVHVFKSVIYQSTEICFSFLSVFAILSWTSIKCAYVFVFCLSYWCGWPMYWRVWGFNGG